MKFGKNAFIKTGHIKKRTDKPRAGYSKYSLLRILVRFGVDNQLRLSATNCLKKVVARKNPRLTKTESNGKQFISIGNVFTCKGLFSCPYCTEVKQQKYRQRALKISERLFASFSNLDVHFATYTLRHQRSDKLKGLLDALTGAYRYATQDRLVRKQRHAAGYLGTDRWLEITYGSKGFHPHIHALHYYEQKDATSSGESFISEYLDQLDLLGKSSLRVAQDLQPNLEQEVIREVSLYPWLTRGVLKKADETWTVKKKSFFLTKRLATLTSTYEPVLKEYLVATKGVHGYHTSPKLIELANASDLDGDTDSVESGADIFIPASVWMRHTRDEFFLENLMFVAAMDFGVEPVCSFLEGYGMTESEISDMLKQDPLR